MQLKNSLNSQGVNVGTEGGNIVQQVGESNRKVPEVPHTPRNRAIREVVQERLNNQGELDRVSPHVWHQGDNRYSVNNSNGLRIRLRRSSWSFDTRED